MAATRTSVLVESWDVLLVIKFYPQPIYIESEEAWQKILKKWVENIDMINS